MKSNIAMRYLLCLILLTSVAYGQDLSGHWTGYLPQPVTHEWTFTVDMTMTQTGNRLSGEARYTSPDNHWVIQYFEGRVNGSTITLHEYKVKSCNCDDNWQFCLKKIRAKFFIDSAKQQYRMDGSWTSDSLYNGKQYIRGSCNPGSIHITKAVKIKLNKPIVVPNFTPITVPSPVPPPIVKKPDVHRDQVIAPQSLAGIPQPVSPVNGPAFVPPQDGFYKKTHIKDSKVDYMGSIREADVAYAKRIWRDIDLREKMNTYMASPKSRLIDIIMDAIADGKITGYDATNTKEDPGGDSFLRPLTPQQVRSLMVDSATVNKIDKNGNIVGVYRVAGDFNGDSVLRFRIKEDWIFDKQRSIFEPHIVGIAPMIRPKTSVGAAFDWQPAFWIYFPEARPVFAKREISNNHNDATGLSYDDAFMKRLFTSFIIKQSNVEDKRIRDYKDGIDRLYESERIKKELLDWELNLWNY